MIIAWIRQTLGEASLGLETAAHFESLKMLVLRAEGRRPLLGKRPPLKLRKIQPLINRAC
jgi:hypothetical protein